MWDELNVVLEVKSPLHIGYLPFKGSVVSPTRYYVPGRNFWGAITKTITEYVYGKPNSGNYKDVGIEVMKKFRFSYFYLFDDEIIYLPRYTDQGLKYGNHKETAITKSEFERNFISSTISTAIDDKGAAKDKSLHEIEFINNRFKDKNGNLKNTKIIGRIWVKENTKIENKEVVVNNSNNDNKGIFIDDFNIIQELTLGGESKYGFGRVQLDSFSSNINFPLNVEYVQENGKKNSNGSNVNESIIKVNIQQNNYLISHFVYDKRIKFKGDIELLAGRGYFDIEEYSKKISNPTTGTVNSNNVTVSIINNEPGKIISQLKYYFSPGTLLIGTINGKVNWDGTIEYIPPSI